MNPVRWWRRRRLAAMQRRAERDTFSRAELSVMPEGGAVIVGLEQSAPVLRFDVYCFTAEDARRLGRAFLRASEKALAQKRDARGGGSSAARRK